MHAARQIFELNQETKVLKKIHISRYYKIKMGGFRQVMIPVKIHVTISCNWFRFVENGYLKLESTSKHREIAVEASSYEPLPNPTRGGVGGTHLGTQPQGQFRVTL